MNRVESCEDPTTPMAQPHKTNGITRRGRKILRAVFLEADQRAIGECWVLYELDNLKIC